MKSHAPMQTLEHAAAAQAFDQAVSAQQWERADQLLETLTGVQTDHTAEQAAILHMHRERWEEAAAAWELLSTKNPQAALRRTLCRNLSSLKTHRPTVYRTLVDADLSDAYCVHAFPDGQQTIGAKGDGQQTTLLSRNPAADVKTAMTQLQPACAQGQPLALLSIGDGHILNVLSRHPQTLQLGMTQQIFLIEPDPRLVLACLLLHDFTGPAGPIEQERVMWYVGRQWLDAFRVDVLTDRYLPFPQFNIKAGLSSASIERSLVRVIGELQKIDARAEQDVKTYYSGVTTETIVRAIRKSATRPPRVMLLTTIFSTVLQYSTRDAADAFRSLGWDVLVVIEPTHHHRMTRCAIRRSLAEFKPDLIFQIDHNRFEHVDLFPAVLPFVDWIQDLLPNLMTPAAGRKIGANDFVLAPSLQRWVDEFQYPARQCLEFRKLTRVPKRPTSWAADANEVVYVSNWSQTAEKVRSDLINDVQGPARDVTQSVIDQMIAVYACGESLPTPGDVRRLLLSAMADLELAGDERLIRQTTSRLFDRMNNLLFRQQGLRWAADACRAYGLRLSIYGNGWENNPEFSTFARGPIGYGEPLEALTRSAGINLILEPFMCTAHQRLLDAIVAGGFCLVRDHPTNQTTDAWIDLLTRVNDSADTGVAVRGMLSLEDRTTFDAIRATCDTLDAAPGEIDHVATVRRLQQAGFLPSSGPMLPLLDQVCFGSGVELADKMMRLSRDDALRSQIARTQRQTITSRYSYAAGMESMLRFVVDRLSESTNSHAKAA